MTAADAFIAVLEGLPLTLFVTLVSFTIGLVLGIPIALLLRSHVQIVRFGMRIIVDIIRGIPIIVWLFILKFGISIGTFTFDSLQAAIVGLGMISSAYLAEVYRGGLATLPMSQVEAAEALGLTRSTKFFKVIAPQAFKIVSPSVANYLISLLKDSSIVSTIVVTEMLFQARAFAGENPDFLGILPYVIAGAIYIVISVPLAVFTRRLDRKIRKDA